jgi:hypothetical protein
MVARSRREARRFEKLQRDGGEDEEADKSLVEEERQWAARSYGVE